MTNPPKVEHVLDIPVFLEAVLPGPVLRIGELLALSEGALIKSTRPVGETVDVMAGGSLIGHAELNDTAAGRAVRMVRFHGSN